VFKKLACEGNLNPIKSDRHSQPARFKRSVVLTYKCRLQMIVLQI